MKTLNTLILSLLISISYAQPALYDPYVSATTNETLPNSGTWSPTYWDQMTFSVNYDWNWEANYTLEVYATAPQNTNVDPGSGYQLIDSVSLMDGWDFGYSCVCTSKYQSVFGNIQTSAGKYIFVRYKFTGGPTYTTSTQIIFNTNKLTVFENLINGELSNTNQGYYYVTDVEPVSWSQTINAVSGGTVFLTTDTSFTDTFYRGDFHFNLTKAQATQAYVGAKRNLNTYSWKFEDLYGYSTSLNNYGNGTWVILFSNIRAWASAPYTIYHTFSGVQITVTQDLFLTDVSIKKDKTKKTNKMYEN